MTYFLASNHQLFAYIDPGTGSFITQIVIAAVVGSSLAIKIYWGKIKLYFNGILGKKGKIPVK